MSGYTRQDIIKNKCIRQKFSIASIVKKNGRILL